MQDDKRMPCNINIFLECRPCRTWLQRVNGSRSYCYWESDKRAVHLSGCFHVPRRVRYTIKKQYWMHRLLTMGLKMCEFRCWGCGATDEGCWWLAAPVGGVAGFCWRSSLGGGGSGRDGGWGSGTTKCKVADKMLHNTVKSRYYVRVHCVFHDFKHFCRE